MPEIQSAPPLTLRPEGILSLFGIQSGGRNPQHLAEDLVPVVDLLGWYHQSRYEIIAGAQVSLSGTGQQRGSLAVPAGQVWLCSKIDLFCDAAIPAGVTRFNFVLGESVNTANTIRSALASTPNAPYVGLDQPRVVYDFDPLLILLPGQFIGPNCTAYAGAGSVTMNVNVRASRLFL